MIRNPFLRATRTIAAFGAAIVISVSGAAETDTQRELRDLKRRVDQLEKRNTELEQALEDEHISEKEPSLASRLKAVEFQALGMQKQARTVESLDGITVGVSFTTVAQSANKTATVDDSGESQLNYRADIAVILPGGEFGNTDGKIFGQFRIGQGNGLTSLRPTYSDVNTSAFQLGGVSQADDSAALLAQVWYQLDMPLPLGGDKPSSRERLTLNFGKIDPFIFFDQNAAANDETRQFLNNVFVHNALLDAGGDTGADAYGFQPGMRLAYLSETQKPLAYGLSVGVFGAGKGAHFENALSAPFVIVQAETHQKFFGGLDGNYRFYMWRNGQAAPYNNPVGTNIEKHAGWGVSTDQRVGDGLTLLGRYGKETKGNVQFDRALSLGVEFGGSYWDRAGDSIGIAAASMHTSAAFHTNSAMIDADGNGTPDFNYTADGAEKVYELYYRYRVHKQFELSPDVQIIQQPGGNRAAGDMKIIGLRGQVTF